MAVKRAGVSRGSSPYVVIRHATPKRNLGSILEVGLLPRLARGKRKAVWLHSPARTAWAILHVAVNHNVTLEDIVVLELVVRRDSLKRHSNGLWWTTEIVDPGRIKGRLEVRQVAESPVDSEAG